MITYLYWTLVFILALGALAFIGGKMARWRIAFAVTGFILLVGLIAYFFHFQQVFVKQYGGVMSITIPEGQYHIGATWKGNDNLWVENYDPEKNVCYFREYSRGNLLQGEVTFKNCNPLMPDHLRQQLSQQPSDDQ